MDSAEGYRNGYGKPRRLAMSSGTITLRRPRDLPFSGLLRALGIAVVPHRFRSSFRDWAVERTDAPHAVMAAALAHVVRNQVEAAYARSGLLERRRVLMEQWAEFPAVGNRNA